MDSERHRLYSVSAFACVIQATAVAGIFFYGLQHPLVTPSSTMIPPRLNTMLEVLLFSWPTWFVILWVLSKSWRRTLIPFGLGLLALSPLGLVILAFIALAHTP